MSRKAKTLVGAIAAIALVAAAWPVYAHCGKCVQSAKEMAKAINGNKVGLSAAVQAAEANSKGQALAVVTQLKGSAVNFSVYCLANEKLMAVKVDGTTGDVVDTMEVDNLPEPSAKHKPGEHDHP